MVLGPCGLSTTSQPVCFHNDFPRTLRPASPGTCVALAVAQPLFHKLCALEMLLACGMTWCWLPCPMRSTRSHSMQRCSAGACARSLARRPCPCSCSRQGSARAMSLFRYRRTGLPCATEFLCNSPAQLDLTPSKASILLRLGSV